MLSAQNIAFTVGRHTIIEPLDIDFKAGEMTALVGPNGAGKSSLLQILSGEIPSHGVIAYGDKSTSDIDITEMAFHRAVLSQSNVLSFAFTVREVVTLGLLIPDAEHIVDKVLDVTELAKKQHENYLTLSGGQKQRCHMARVLAQIYTAMQAGYKPVVFLDEPTAALDITHEHAVLNIAKQLTRDGLAVIIVLHDLNVASQYADRVVILQQGQIFADGTVAKTMTKQNLEAVYQHPVDIIPHKGKMVIYPQNND